MNEEIILFFVTIGSILLGFLVISILIWFDKVNDIVNFYEYYREELEDLVFKRRCKK